MSQAVSPCSPIEEVAGFFAHAPSLAETAQFHLSEVAQNWISDLLDKEDKENDDALAAEERQQFDDLLIVQDIVTRIRSHAHQ